MDYILLVVAAALGAHGSHWGAVLVIASLLSLLSARKQIAFARIYSGVESTRTALLMGATFANNLVFATMSFALGRAVVWLLAT